MLNFFKRKKGMDNTTSEAEYLYKAVEFNDNFFNFSFNDFVGNKDKEGEFFANRLGAFFSLAHIALTMNNAALGDNGIKGFITRLDGQNIKQYNEITDVECEDINKYFMDFAYTFEKGVFVPGWLYQIRNSVAPGTFMFDSKAFPDTQGDLKKLDVGALFLDKKYHWPSGGLLSNRHDKFVKELIESVPKEEQKVNTTKEKFLAHIYNAITKSQNF